MKEKQRREYEIMHKRGKKRAMQKVMVQIDWYTKIILRRN